MIITMNAKGFFLLLLFVLSISAVQGITNPTEQRVEITIEPNQATMLEFRGLAYGPFRGVGPDNTEIVPKANIEEDMRILQEMGTNHIRTYGIGLGLNQIPFIAAQYGIETATGTWIHTGNPDNFGEIDTALEAESVSSMIIVGNEVLTGSVGFTEPELVGFVEYAQDQRVNTTFPVATAEEWVHFAKNNSLTLELETTAIGNAVDTIIMHAHPAWHYVPIAEAANWTIERYFEVANLYPNKTVILGETGWPSESTPENPLFTTDNQVKFYTDLLALIDQYDIKAYLFAAFDENWKGEMYEGNYNIGPYWGLIEEKRYGKPASAVVADYFGGTIDTTAPPEIDATINSPSDKTLELNEKAIISWVITDDPGTDGTYTIYKNDVVQGIADLVWQTGIPINWNIDTSIAGVFTYKITFTAENGITGEDTVVVTVGSGETENTGSIGVNGFGLIISVLALFVLATRSGKPLLGRVKN